MQIAVQSVSRSRANTRPSGSWRRMLMARDRRHARLWVVHQCCSNSSSTGSGLARIHPHGHWPLPCPPSPLAMRPLSRFGVGAPSRSCSSSLVVRVSPAVPTARGLNLNIHLTPCMPVRPVFQRPGFLTCDPAPVCRQMMHLVSLSTAPSCLLMSRSQWQPQCRGHRLASTACRLAAFQTSRGRP
jgi:hypothetical protein